MCRTFLAGLLVAACAALALAPVAGAAKPSVTITNVSGYSDGSATVDGNTVCTFHATITYTTTGRTPKGLQASAEMNAGSGALTTTASKALGPSPFNPGSFYVSASNSNVSYGGSTYSFTGRITDNRGKLWASFTTALFSLNATTYVNGCPPYSASPLVSTTFP